jgi:hypothetical protein
VVEVFLKRLVVVVPSGSVAQGKGFHQLTRGGKQSIRLLSTTSRFLSIFFFREGRPRLLSVVGFVWTYW